MGDLTIKTEGDVKSVEDGIEVIENYKKRKENPQSNVGMYSLYDRVDDVCRGLKPGELMLIAAYVKQGKTIFTSNIAYNGIIQGMNGLFVSLEMNYDEMRDLYYVLHGCHSSWYKNPQVANLIGKVTYDKVTYAELSEEEQRFFEMITRDFSTRSDFGKLFMYQPTEALTPSKLEMIAYDYNSRLRDVGKQLDFLIVDYVGLMVPDKSEKYGDWNIDLNNIIKKLKSLALNFDNGRKLRVISPFQVNRTGFKEAEKNEGQFALSALSNANEAERSSDVILSTYMTKDMKKSGIIKIGCLANRRGGEFDPFEAKIDFGTRHIKEFIQKASGIADTGISGIQNIPLDA